MDFSPIQFVPLSETIADIALREKASAGLATTSTILLSVLVVSTFSINLMLLATILSSYKLRNCLLYLMFCTTAALNVIDVVLIMFLSLLYVANGHWFMGEIMCRLNASAQQFVFMMSLFEIMLMAIERALGLIGRHLVKPKNFAILSIAFFVASCCFSIPLFITTFPVQIYRSRFLCAIGSHVTISYTIVQILIYGGCLFVLLLCFGSLLRYRLNDRHLPVKPQDYGAFIMESRALQDHVTLGKLVLFIAISYFFIQGPYIVLCFFVQTRNSVELIARYGELEMPQDVDILLTLLRFIFPLITPLLILCTCSDIYTKFVNLLFCRRDVKQSFNAWRTHPNRVNSTMHYPDENNVLTLVATTDGLQLRVPTKLSNQTTNQKRQHQKTILTVPAQQCNNILQNGIQGNVVSTIVNNSNEHQIIVKNLNKLSAHHPNSRNEIEIPSTASANMNSTNSTVKEQEVITLHEFESTLRKQEPTVSDGSGNSLIVAKKKKAIDKSVNMSNVFSVKKSNLLKYNSSSKYKHSTV